MECQKARDQFSLLLEGGLNPAEEEKLRDHLASCQDCRKDWERFNEMIRLLHSMEEVEVPDGFFSGIKQKREEPNQAGILEGERKKGRRWLSSLRIPVQAMAMVMVLFLAFYLTKMTSIETVKQKGIEETIEKEVRAPGPEGKKKEGDVVSGTAREESLLPWSPKTEETKEREGPPTAAFRDEVKTPSPSSPLTTSAEKKSTANIAAGKAAPEASRPKETEKSSMGLHEELRPERQRTGIGKAGIGEGPSREITLKISDREKAIAQIRDLVGQYDGEMSEEEKNIFIASVPISASSEFERRLAQLGPLIGGEKIVLQKERRDEPILMNRVRGREDGKKEGYIALRIRLLQE